MASPIPVGQLLAIEIEEHGWTQAEFASVLGRPVQFVSEIVNGRKELTRESAAQLGAALGQTAEFWLRFQDEYLLNEQKKNTVTQRQLTEVRRRARLNQLVPVSTLRKRGIIKGTTLDELEVEIADLLELGSINDEPSFTIAARRSNHDEPVSPLQKAWAACVRREARKQHITRPFDREGLAKLAKDLPAILDQPAAFKNLPSIFAALGVGLVYVEALPAAKIDGCAFMLDDMPVIALSGRGKRLDKVLWTLLHEVAHVVLDHVSAQIVIETLEDHDDDQDESDVEKAADKAAGAWLFPDPLPRPATRVSAGWVNAQAAKRGIAPIVVIGNLQKRGLLDWRTTLARNAPNVDSVLGAWQAERQHPTA